MKNDYSRTIQLRCVVCGSDNDFECNEDKSYIKCKKCNREYFGGYDELVEQNQANIQDEVGVMKMEIKEDWEKDIHEMFKNAFKGNKHIKFK